MYFPEDIVSIIREYEKPLQRIRTSKYWMENPSSNKIDTVVRKFELYIGSISSYFRVEHFHNGIYRSIKAYINTGHDYLHLHCILRFTERDVETWNGRNFECTRHTIIWNLTKDITYTLGMHNDKVVKVIHRETPIPNIYHILQLVDSSVNRFT
jgi:hypothetical protein